MNRCRYCLAAHTALARSAGLSDEEIADSRRSTATDRKAEAVLRLARRIVEEHGRVSDDDLAAARGAGLAAVGSVEAGAVAALTPFSNSITHVAGTEGVCPEVTPPPAQASLH